MLTAYLLCGVPVVQSKDFRDYETASGQMISGRVVKFDAKTEEVMFLRAEDRQLLQANLRAFSESERTFIRDWSVANEFLNGLNIFGKLYWEKNKDLSDQKRLVQTVGYEVLFESTKGYPFGEVEVEYCIYYKQGRINGKKMYLDHGVCHGNGMVKLETVQQKDILQTQTFTLYFLRGSYTLFGSANNVEGAVEGIWVRAQVLLPSGQACYREYRSATDEDWKWSTESVPVGLNRAE